MEITLKLTADPKLETLLDKLCNALDLGNGLPFTATQTTPVKPAAVTTVAPVNPTPAVTTAAPTTAAVPVTTSAPTVATAPSPTVPVTTTVPVAAPAPVTTQPAPVTTQPAPAANAVPQQTTVPTAAPTYQIADLARAAATLMDAGKQPQLLALLAQFGVQSLGQLKPEQFGQFATALRGLGAKL